MKTQKKHFVKCVENWNIYFCKISCHLLAIFHFAVWSVTSFTLHRWLISLKIVSWASSLSFIRGILECCPVLETFIPGPSTLLMGKWTSGWTTMRGWYMYIECLLNGRHCSRLVHIDHITFYDILWQRRKLKHSI